ncbi:MAG: DNA polymerase III subunit alpha [Rhodospirillaceae bacterium]|nr:DNA polymerase III subunit alpha [Rhodospirillaceae bacterium]|tara:strand:+ start:18632 stop:22102 length:3471 start_codon:yes stop_codon:yes gene_type:complete
MTYSNFVHLNVHSAYSLAESALRIEDIIDLCKKYQMPAIAITDNSNMFGALEFSNQCVKNGIKPIIGLSVFVEEFIKDDKYLSKFVLLAQNQEGYKNLLKLSSKSFLKSDLPSKPKVKIKDLYKYNTGLIALTGGPGSLLNKLILKKDFINSKKYLENINQLFKNRLYIEIQRHSLENEKLSESELINLAYSLNIPIVATNEPYFSDESMYLAHDALICISSGKYLDDNERVRFSSEHRFKSAEEMSLLFADLPEAIENTILIAKRCSFIVPNNEPMLPKFKTKTGETEELELTNQSEKGLIERIQSDMNFKGLNNELLEKKINDYKLRLKYELEVINKMGFAGYFLIVADFIKWAKIKNIPVGPGRGSGAGSLVAWALTITDLDPIRFGLIFERFLNPDRISMPDFDIDFCQERRDEVIDYVKDRYGEDNVAQIITFGSLQARAALRDVGRVLQLPYNLVDKICKMVPFNPANPIKLEEAIKSDERFGELIEQDETIKNLIDISIKLEGLYRHASTHAAGLVISDKPLIENVPLYRDPRSEMPITQFSMKYAELSGLVKFDFLGLKTLTVIEKTINFLKNKNINIDINNLPLDDEKTFTMLQKGESIGVFQLESSGMRELLKDSKPSKFEDLIALIALYRPGPMENIPKYISCKNGTEDPEFLHKTIEPIVSDTYGVIIYQEQVMQIAQVFAGYSLGQADILRRAMGKKIKSEMASQRDIFVKGAIKLGVENDRAEYVFDLVDKFAGYGFNKAHSAGYALISYQTAWLKANYPVEFLAATMCLDINNTDKLSIFIKESKNLGIKILQPDINLSESEFIVEEIQEKKFGIRYGLSAIKNVGKQAMDSLIKERNSNGKFLSIADFASRINPSEINKRQIESLAKSGSFDSLDINRASIFYSTERILKFSSKIYDDKITKQSNLFGNKIDDEEISIKDIKNWSELDILKEEFDSIGFYLSSHPLDSYKNGLKRLGVSSYDKILNRNKSDNGKVILAGSVESVQERISARGNKYAFVQLSDLSGSFEVVFFSEQFNKYREQIITGRRVLLFSDYRFNDGQIRITVNILKDLDESLADSKESIEIHFSRHSEREKILNILNKITEILKKSKNGESKIMLRVPIPEENKEVEIETPGEYLISQDLINKLKIFQSDINIRKI